MKKLALFLTSKLWKDALRASVLAKRVPPRWNLALFIAWQIITVLFAGNIQAQPTNQQKHVVASFYPLYIHTLNVAAGATNIVIDCLAPKFSGCPHDYALTTADRRLISKGDLIIINGDNLEPYAGYLKRSKKPVIDTTVGLKLLPGNPHVWLSPRIAISQVEKIGQALAELDPGNAALYAQNTAAYTKKLGQLLEKMQKATALFKEKKFVAAHEGFAYLAADLDLTIVATIASDHEMQPSAHEIARVIKLMLAHGLNRIISDKGTENKAAQTVAAATGAKIYGISLITAGPVERDAYLKLMEENLQVLEKAAGR